jgi:hypothetical protein
MQDNIDIIECALLDLESFMCCEYRLDEWTAGEMRELKKACKAVVFGDDLYRAMVAYRNNWTHRGGRADINQVEQWMREYDPLQNDLEHAAA